MLQSSLLADVFPSSLSFKHTLQLWLSGKDVLIGDDEQNAEKKPAFLMLVAQKTVGNRPGRIEPRAVKRRAKPYALLTKKREAAREHLRKFGHPKKVK